MERQISKFFKTLQKRVEHNFNEYWTDTALVQGQVNMITAPIEEAHEEYYRILEKYIKREYQLGAEEARRLVELANDKHANKSIKKLKTFFRKSNLFGTNPEAEADLLNKVFTASKRTLARVTTKINQILTDGYTSGAGINIVANMLTKQFNQLETWEAKRIARTEIHNSHNKATMDIYKTMNVSYTQWIAANDDRTRDSHAEINGEIIPMGGTYSNGLKYPGDTDGDISEWINCRCSNAPYVMPYGYMAPVGMEQFYEEDIIKIN